MTFPRQDPMKACLLVLFILFISSSAFSQNVRKEFGLRTNGLSGLGFIYKKQRTDSSYNRFSLEVVNVGHNRSTTVQRNRTNVRIGLSLGRERRTRIEGPLKFIRGIDPRLNLSAVNEESNGRKNERLTVRPSLGYLVGLHYDIDPHVYLNLQASPHIYGRFPWDLTDKKLREYTTGIGVDYGITVAFKL